MQPHPSRWPQRAWHTAAVALALFAAAPPALAQAWPS
jgi:hypothetical protein